MERRSTRSKVSLDDDILKVPLHSPMKQARRARTNTASSSRSRLAEIVTAATEDDELLLYPNKRNATPSDSARKRSASPTPANDSLQGTPEEGRELKRVKRDEELGKGKEKEEEVEALRTWDPRARVAGAHTRTHSDSNVVSKKVSQRLTSRLVSEKPRSAVSDEALSRQNSLPPADNGRAQSVPVFPSQNSQSYPHLDLRNLPRSPAHNRSRSRSPSKNPTPKNPLKPLPQMLTRLPSIRDEGASKMDVDENPLEDDHRDEKVISKSTSDTLVPVHGSEQISLGLAVETTSTEIASEEPAFPPAQEGERPVSPLTPAPSSPEPEEVPEAVVEVEPSKRPQPTRKTQTRASKASKVPSSSNPVPPLPVREPEIQKKPSQSRLPRATSSMSQQLTMAVVEPATKDTKTTKTPKAAAPSGSSKPIATVPTAKRNAFDLMMKRPERFSSSLAKEMSVMEKAKGVLASVPSMLAKGKGKKVGNATTTKASSMKGKMKGKGAKAEAKPAPALVPIPSDEEDMLVDDEPRRKEPSPDEKAAEVVEPQPVIEAAMEPEPDVDEPAIAEPVYVLGERTIPGLEPPLALKEPAHETVPKSGNEGEQESSQPPHMEEVVPAEETNSFVIEEDQPMAITRDANAEESTRVPSPADITMDNVEEPQHIEYLVPLAGGESDSEPTLPGEEEPVYRSAPEPSPLKLTEDVLPKERSTAGRASKKEPLEDAAAGKKRAPSVMATAPRVTRSSTSRNGGQETQPQPAPKSTAPLNTKQTTLNFPKLGAPSTSTRRNVDNQDEADNSIPPVSARLKRKVSDDGKASVASTSRKSVGPSLAPTVYQPLASTSISSRTRRKSVGPTTEPEAYASISGRTRRKSIGAKLDTSGDGGMPRPPPDTPPRIDLTTDSPRRRSTRHPVSISTPTLRTPASSPTKGTTRKTSVSPSKRAARSASPSPTKKAVRSFSMIGGRPDLNSMADNRFVKTGSSLSTLANALEALRMPAPSRPSTTLGFNDNDDSDDDSPFIGNSSKTQDNAAVGKNAVAGSSRGGATVGRATTFGANHFKNKIGAIGTAGRMGPFGARDGAAGRGKPMFGVGPLGRKLTQKASKNPALPMVMGSPVKGDGGGDISMTSEEEENLRNGFQGMIQRTAEGDDSDVEVEAHPNKGKGKARAGDSSRRASMASQFLLILRARALAPEGGGGGPMVPLLVDGSERREVRDSDGSSIVTTEEGASDAAPPGRRSTRTAAAAASQAIANVAASSRRAPAVEPPPAPDEALKFLKDCIIFVDVRTEEGEEAGSLFMEMLEVAGARLLQRVGQTCTHIVYKNGLQSTINRYRQLRDPKPIVVGIAWVVECIEQRRRVDEADHAIDLEEVSLFTNPAKRRRSLLPKLISRDASDFSSMGDNHYRDNSNEGDISMDGSTSSVGMDDMTPLERARNRRQSALPPPPQLSLD